ncbi:MAG: EAL domain-containing protein [Lachnospiraceae bacterium]|nr:EAL domain-containing protein [Lachnospiraceae bacterium]
MTISDARKHRLEGLFRAFSIVADGTYVYVCDMINNYSKWSKSAVDYFGLPDEYMEDAGKIWGEHVHPDDKASYDESINELFSGKSSSHDMQYRALGRDGNYVMCTCRGVILYNEDHVPEYFCGAIRNHGLYGHVNGLTGLRNKYGFFEDLKVAISKEQGFVVSALSLTHFSAINTVYGYEFGNLVVQKFARKLVEVIGNRGLIYRLDGVKFGIISDILSIDELKSYYERIRKMLNDGFVVDNRAVSLQTSAGALEVDHFPVSDKVVYSCLVYSVGNSKRYRQGDMEVFDNKVSGENIEKLDKLEAIRNSVANDYEGFCLYYQPVIDAETEKLKGAEALIRWRNDKFGLVFPNDFIPVLENDTIFPALGEWILIQAMTDAKRFIAKYPDFVININLSYVQLKRTDFVETVCRILAETGFPTRNLCFELTERCRFIDKEILYSTLTTFRDMGIRIALDDFGTGFASIDILKYIPFDTIKIERVFVKDITFNEKEKKLLGFFTGVAAIYGSDVCVEGVEDEVIRDIVKKYHVDSLQGYFYSKAIAFEDFNAKYIDV